jgi:hypothetical protein
MATNNCPPQTLTVTLSGPNVMASVASNCPVTASVAPNCPPQTGQTQVYPGVPIPGPPGPAGPSGPQGPAATATAGTTTTTAPGTQANVVNVGSTSAAVFNFSIPQGAVGPAGPQGPSYVLPVATTSVLGGVKQGSGVTIAADGTLSSSGAASPLTAKGDIWGFSTANARIPVGTDGQVLTASSAAALGVAWAAPTGGGGGVTSFNTRTGAVVPASGDYTAAQVTNAVSTVVTYPDPAWITSLSWSKITGAPATGVSSVFSRTGAVVAAAGDYTAAQVTNAVSTISTYADPAWITALAWGKITGAPSFLADPTTTKGDLIARGASPPATRLPVGATLNMALLVDASQALGVKWATMTASMITNAVDSTQTYANPAWITALAWSKITGAPAIYTDPLTTAGDILFRSASATTRLAIGAAGQVLTVSGGLPIWANASGGGYWVAGSGGAIYYNGGNVGIGVAVPVTTFQVRGANGASGLSPQSYTTVLFENGSTAYLELAANASPGPPNCGIVWSSGSSQTSYMIDYNGAVYWMAVGASRPIAIYTNSLERMRITPAGNVGIGTTGPQACLHVIGSSGDPAGTYGSLVVSGGDQPHQVRIGYNSTSNYGWIQAVQDAVGQTILSLNGAGGNVGIGTTNPANTLQVVRDAGGVITNFGLSQIAISGASDSRKTLWLTFDTNNNVGAIQAGIVGVSWNSLLLNPDGGNVSIGTTTNPVNMLEVWGPYASPATSGSAANGTLRLVPTGHGEALDIGTMSGGAWLQARNYTNYASQFSLLLNPNGGNVGIGTSTPPGVFIVSCYGGQAYSYFNTNPNSTSTYPAVNYGLALTWNNSGGAGESDFFNTYTPAGGASFQFFQLLSASSARTVMTIDVNGNVNIPGAYKVNGVPISGGITTQTKPSRALNTVYQNTTGKPMFVTVDVQTSSGFGFNCLTDGSNPPGTTVTNGSIGGSALTAYISASFWVLPGNFYEVTGQGPLVYWTEWY